MKKSCKKGYYYCFTSKKCKKIPVGHHVMPSGRLMKDSEHEETESGEESTETKKNGNGSNGNGGAVSEGWSEKYKRSIDCKNPKGFSQRAHCQGKKKVNEQNNDIFHQGNPNPQMRNMPMGQRNVDKLANAYSRSARSGLIDGANQMSQVKKPKLMKSDSVRVAEAKEKGDHEVSMAQSQLKKSEENIRKLRKALGTKEKNIPAWVQAKITDTEHNTDAASSYMDEGKRDGKSAKDKDYSLRDWFKGGGWVQAGGKYDGKPCAKQKGQKTKPFCRDADDRANMSKKERNRRAAKKRREDPNPNRKGKAKMVREAYDTTGTRFEKMKGDPVINALKATKEFKQMKGELVKTAPVKLANSFCNWRQELELSEEGKKDACYHKVKSRYSVWPSAYASGALVKCRKVGAKNWGNKTKKEGYEFSNWRDDFQPTEFEATDLITPDPIQVPPSNLQKIEEKCWDGYTQKGMKKKGKRLVPNCVKEAHSNWREELAESGYDSTYGRGESEPKGTQYLKVDPNKFKKDMEFWKNNLKNAPPLRQASAKKTTQVAHFEPEGELIEDWQKVNRKDKTDGMSQKAVNAYKRENPGSKLKTAVTGKVKKGSKDAKRRKSFCSRSNGQRKMHNIDCSKTPEKKICKARKRWKC